MACKGTVGDYSCQGWRDLADRALARDGIRCRGCNRSKEDIRLEVHHRTYGTPGKCGECVLAGVTLEDVVTLCIDCHEAVTNVRRRIRYGARTLEIELVQEPTPVRSVVRVRATLEPEKIQEPEPSRAMRRKPIDEIFGRSDDV